MAGIWSGVCRRKERLGILVGRLLVRYADRQQIVVWQFAVKRRLSGMSVERLEARILTGEGVT